MTDAHAAYGGPYTKKYNQSSPEDLLRRIREENLGMSLDDEKLLFRERVLQDHDMNIACIDWVWVAAGRNVTRYAPPPELERAEAKYKGRKTAAEEAKQKAREKVVQSLSVFISRIAEMTFGEVGKMAKKSKQLAKLATMGKPYEVVGQVMTAAAITKVINAR